MGLGFLVISLAVDLNTFFKRLLGIVPGAAGIVLENSPKDTTHRYTGHISAQRFRTHDEADDDRRDNGDDTRKHHLTKSGGGGDLDATTILRLSGSFEDARDLTELATNFVHHVHGSFANRVHGKRGEDDWHHASDEERGEHLRVENVDALDARKGHIGGEQRKSRQCRGSDGKTFTDSGSGVAHRVEYVCLLAYLGRKFTHLGNTAGVVGDRSECIDGKLHSRGRHHGGGGDTHTVETGQQVSAPDRSGEKDDRHGGRKHTGAETRDDVGCRAGSGFLDNRKDRLLAESGVEFGDVGNGAADEHADHDRPEDVHGRGSHLAELSCVEHAHRDRFRKHEPDQEERSYYGQQDGKPVAFVQGRLHGIGVGLCIVGNPYEERTEDRCEDADTGNG